MRDFPKKKALLKFEPLSRLLTFIWTHLLLKIWNTSENGLSGGNKGPDFSGSLVNFIRDYADRGMEKRSGDPRQSDTVLA